MEVFLFFFPLFLTLFSLTLFFSLLIIAFIFIKFDLILPCHDRGSSQELGESVEPVWSQPVDFRAPMANQEDTR